MNRQTSLLAAPLLALGVLYGLGGCAGSPETEGDKSRLERLSATDRSNLANANRMFEEGKQVFRFDTFGSEAFWGDALQLHKAIAGERGGGVGAGLTATTLALLKLNAMVGVRGLFDAKDKLVSVGLQCAFCHSTVDDSFAPGIGKRLDAWAARDLNVGAVIALAPNLKPLTDLLGVDEATVRKVLASWGPGRFDALLDKDGKAFRPDGGQAGTLIPPAFGLAGINLHTWTGFGSVPYWNAYVAVTELRGSGAFFDARLGDPNKYPIAARTGSFDTRGKPDLVTSKLAALHFYQLAIPAPRPPVGSYDAAPAERGKVLFNDKAKCSICHVPPIFTEPGNNLHAPSEVGVDAFQADRSPTGMYKTAPLAGLWTHEKGGFYHDGRFATLREVLQHYDVLLRLGLSEGDKANLIEYLKSL